MAKIIDGGWVPENDPMFGGSVSLNLSRKRKHTR